MATQAGATVNDVLLCDLFATIRQMMLMPPHLSRSTSGIVKTDAPGDPAPSIRSVFYVNRTGMHWLAVQAMRNRNVLLSLNDYAGKPDEGINGIPIKVSDQLLTTESRVV